MIRYLFLLLTLVVAWGPANTFAGISSNNDASTASRARHDFNLALDMVHSYDQSTQSRLAIEREVKSLALKYPASGYSEIVAAEFLSTYAVNNFGGPPELVNHVHDLLNRADSYGEPLPETNISRVRILLRQQKFDQAQALLDRMAPEMSNSPSFVFMQADLLRRTKKFREAASFYEKFISLMHVPGRKLNGYYWLAVNYTDAAKNEPGLTGQYRTFLHLAEKTHKAALEFSPRHPRTLEQYAEFLIYFREDPLSASELARKVLEIEPRRANSKAYVALAQFYQYAQERGKYDEARQRADIKAIENRVGVSVFDVFRYVPEAAITKRLLGVMHASMTPQERAEFESGDPAAMRALFRKNARLPWTQLTSF